MSIEVVKLQVYKGETKMLVKKLVNFFLKKEEVKKQENLPKIKRSIVIEKQEDEDLIINRVFKNFVGLTDMVRELNEQNSQAS